MNRYDFSSAVKTKHRYTTEESLKHCAKMQQMLTKLLADHYEGSVLHVGMLGYKEAEQLILHFKTDEPQDLILAVTHYLDTLVNEKRLFYIVEGPSLTFNGDAQFVCDMTIGKGYRRFQGVEDDDE